jgi:hypothetical protein
MGLFDGLIAKVEGAVTSAESRAAGLVTEAASAVGVPPTWLAALTPTPPAPTPSTPYTTPWVGPLLPGQSRPSPMIIVPQIATPAASPAPSSTFNMVEDMMAKIPGVSAVESYFGLTPSTPAPGAPPDYSADVQAWGQDLTRWSNILKSLDGSMNAHDGASDLSAAVRAWLSGPCADALTQVAALQNGHTPYAKAQAVYTDAIAQAKALQAAIQSRWSDFSAQGSPGIARYALAPVTAPFEYAYAGGAAVVRGTQAVVSGAEAVAARAGSAIGKAAGGAADSTATLLKYAPWALAGLAALYVLPLLPRARRD